jgi:hypothetical protein
MHAALFEVSLSLVCHQYTKGTTVMRGERGYAQLETSAKRAERNGRW